MSISPKIQEVIKQVDEYCDANISEERVKQWCISRGIPSSEYQAFYESEIGKYCIPVFLGGYDAPYPVYVEFIMRMMRRAGAMLPYHADMNSKVLLSVMDEAAQQAIAENLCTPDGRVLCSQSFSEGSFQRKTGNGTTEVTMDDGVLYLNGEKTFVANGQFAPNTLVLTRDTVLGTEDDDESLWIVPISTLGISTFPLNTIGQEMLAPARIVFDHVRLKPEWRIETNGQLKSMIKHQYMLGRINVCAASIGLAEAAMDDALARCSEYKTRDKYLRSIPQIQIKLSEMAVKIRSMKNLVNLAAKSVDSDEPFEEKQYNCLLMKQYVPKAATEVASEALQIFGGVGYTDESRVSRIWQDCRGNQIAQGSDEMMSTGISKHLIKSRACTLKDV